MEFLNKGIFSNAREAFDLHSNFIRKGHRFDRFRKQTKFTAIVITTPIELSRADLDEAYKPPEPGSNDITKFAFKGRIIDEDSPHQYLPDICDLQVARSFGTMKDLVRVFALHTTFISSDDYTISKSGMPKVGDIVNVELRTGIKSYNLQFGKFINVAADHKGGTAAVGDAIKGCVQVHNIFKDSFDYKKLGDEMFDIASAISATKKSTRLGTTRKAPPTSIPPPIPAREVPTVTASEPGKYVKLFFGDSQMDGSYGQTIVQFFGKPNSTRIGKHSTQPRDWRRCVGTGDCEPSSIMKGHENKVRTLWASLDKIPDLLVISLGGNGISHLDSLISEIGAVIDGKKTKVIWQGAPPPVHKTDSGTGTKFYGKLSKYNRYYKSRHQNSMKIKAKVEAKGWLFVDPYEHLLLSDGKTAGYSCKGLSIDKCDGVHLTSAAAKELVMEDYPKILPEEYKIFLE